MVFTPVALSENLAAEVSHTLPHQGKFARDLLFRLDGSTLEWFQKNGMVEVREGRDIREPILVQCDQQIKRLVSDMDSADVHGFNPDMTLRDVWKDYGAILVISENELDDNSGAAKILDVMSMKRDFAVKQMIKAINDDILYTGANNHINSLVYQLSDTPATAPSVHGYDPATYTFMQHKQVTGGSAATGVLEAALNQGVITAQKSQGSAKIKALLSSPVSYRYFQNSKIPLQVVQLSGSASNVQTTGEIGFMGIPWKWDVAVPSDTRIYGISDGIKLYTKGKAMSFGKPMDVIDQWFMAWKMKVRLQLMFLEQPRSFVVTSVAA